jgi:hypothetical protein
VGVFDWFFGGGSSQVEEPNGRTDWLGNPVNSPSSRGGQGTNDWWGPVEQANRNDESGWDGWI